MRVMEKAVQALRPVQALASSTACDYAAALHNVHCHYYQFFNSNHR
jgi:hypothetical protein